MARRPRFKDFLSFNSAPNAGPGFRISRQYYLTVMAATSVLPSIAQVIEPKGKEGAVPGKGVPLAEGLTKESLQQPMIRGTYAFATNDTSTVMKVTVLPKEEVGFDPQQVVRADPGRTLDPEMQNRLLSTWSLIQLTYESHHAAVWPSIEFGLALGRRFAELTGGLVADQLSARYLLPEMILAEQPMTPLSATTEIVALEVDGDLHLKLVTRGMHKIGLPEFVLRDVPAHREAEAEQLMLSAVESTFANGPKSEGELPESNFILAVCQDEADALEFLPRSGSVADALAD